MTMDNGQFMCYPKSTGGDCMKYGFGVDLGGTTVKIAYFDETGNMLSKWEIPTDRAEGGKNILTDIAKAIEGYITNNYVNRQEVVGIGIGV